MRFNERYFVSRLFVPCSFMAGNYYGAKNSFK